MTRPGVTHGARSRTRRTAVAAGAWSAVLVVVATSWTATGQGYPFGPDRDTSAVLSPIGGVPATIGAPLAAAIRLVGVVVAISIARRPSDGGSVGRGITIVAWTLAAILALLVLARAASQEAAREIVHRRGLASLADRWFWYSRLTGEWQVVVPLEATPGRVRVALGYYSLPGVETATITTSDLDAGDRLTLEPPDRAATL